MKEILLSLDKVNYDSLSSSEFESVIFSFLRKFGEVKRQVFVDNRCDGKKGRVDFVLNFNGLKVGIEADRKTPRKKSIFKLKRLNLDERYVITREPFSVITIE